MSVAKVTELTAEHPESFEAATREGIARAAKTIQNIRNVWVKDHEIVIKNNQPKYVVLSEERYRDLLEAEDEAYIARVRASLEDVKAGRVRRFKSAAELLKALEAEDDK